MRYIRQELEYVAQQIVKEAQEYPPELEGQKYVRTYTLQGAWDIGLVEEATNGSLELLITNDASDSSGEQYAEKVMGQGTQRPIHQGRWETIEEIQARHSHEQANRIAGAIRRGLSS